MRSSGCSGRPSCARGCRAARARRSPSWARTASTDASSSCSRRRAGDDGAVANGERPRILMVGRMRYSLPLPDWLAGSSTRSSASSTSASSPRRDRHSPATDERFRLLEPSRLGMLDGVLFYLRLPFHVRRQIIDFRPGGDHRREPLHGRAGARRPRARLRAEAAGRGRGARRLADGDAALRVAVAALPVAARGRRRAHRGPPRRRRRARCRATPRASSRRCAGFRRRPPSRPTWISPPSPRSRPQPLPGAADGALRRDARGLQEHRRPRGGVAAGRARASRSAPRDRRRREPPGRGRRAGGELPEHVEHIEQLPPVRGLRADGPLDGARAALPLGGSRTGAGRVVRARSRGRREPSRGDPGRRARRREALLVESGDVDALAAALVRVLSDRPARGTARRGRVRALPASWTRLRPSTRRACARSSIEHSRETALMRLVFVTQRVDADDPILGATVAKLRALAQRCDELVVITDRIGVHDLPANARCTRSEPRPLGRGLRYMRALVPLLLSRRRADALIAHMCPIYLVLAAPLAKIVRVPLAIWYTHWAIDWELPRRDGARRRRASASTAVPTRSTGPRCFGIGHGIDVAQFGARDAAPPGNGTLRLLALGRTSPSKGFATLVRACGLAKRGGMEAAGRDPWCVDDGRGAATSPRPRDADRGGRAERRGDGRRRVPRPRVPELVRGVGCRRQHDLAVSPPVVRWTRSCTRRPRGRPRASPATRTSTSSSAIFRSTSCSQATTTPISRACCTSSPRPTRTVARLRVASCGGGSRPATPLTAGRTQSSRRFGACATERGPSSPQRRPDLRRPRRRRSCPASSRRRSSVRALGTEQFGIWALIGSILGFIGLLDLGIGPSLIRFAAEQRGRDDARGDERARLDGVRDLPRAGLSSRRRCSRSLLAWLLPLFVEISDQVRASRADRGAPLRRQLRDPLPGRPLRLPARGPAALRRAQHRQPARPSPVLRPGGGGALRRERRARGAGC